MKSAFLDKLVDRLDRMDPQSVQTQFLRLVQEKGLLETIFQSIQEGVIVVDAEGRINYVNRAGERLLGLTDETARGRHISVFLREMDWDRVLTLDPGEWSKLVNTEIEISYPEKRFVNFYVVPLALASSNGAGGVIMLRDVTRERRAEENLLESERLNAVKLLAAGVAHEIGNPLNALNIHLQLLDREIRALCPSEPDARPEATTDRLEKLRELLQVARNEVSRLDMIITQFLRAIRPARPNPVPTQVADLLQETLALLKEEIENRKIRVEIDQAEVVPQVPVDRNQMKQAFFNVIRNALQAMRDGGCLKIAVATTSNDLAVTFHDSGVGIRPEDFGHIFEPYYTTKSEGSGLGLMIVQRIVQEHGGQIEVVSKPGTGTKITLLLPLAERRVRLLKAQTGNGGKA